MRLAKELSVLVGGLGVAVFIALGHVAHGAGHSGHLICNNKKYVCSYSNSEVSLGN